MENECKFFKLKNKDYKKYFTTSNITLIGIRIYHNTETIRLLSEY